jgi:hypothetical protein
VPRLATADVVLGTARRPRAVGTGAAADRRARARAAAGLTGDGLLELRPLDSLAGVGLLGSSPFTLAGDPAAGSLLPAGALTLDELTGEAPAGIGAFGSGPIASGNQVDANVGDVSPSVPVTICGNGAGVLGDASASCGTSPPSGTTGGSGSEPGVSDPDDAVSAPAGTGGSGSAEGSLLGDIGAGNQVDAGIGSISPSVPLTVCGNGVGALGDASASCGPSGQPGGASGGSAQAGAGAGNQADVSADGVSAEVPLTACGNGVGLLGDASASCGTTSASGTTAPPPGTTSPDTPGRTDTVGIPGTPGSGSTGTAGLIPGTPGSGSTGTAGLIPGTTGPGGASTSVALRPSGTGPGALAFTGAAGDLLAMAAAALLAAGALFLRAARSAVTKEGGGGR